MRISSRRCLIPELLAKRGLSQRQLANAVGMDERVISRYVAENSMMSFPTAVMIADVLKCNPRDLYEWSTD
ncbi:helix-turn-helix domain-containing protein [Paenibacillus sp. CAU 1782]|jgi:DNA-binding Xre family transcriptional regulator